MFPVSFFYRNVNIMRPPAEPCLPLHPQCLEQCPGPSGPTENVLSNDSQSSDVCIHPIWNLDHFANFRFYNLFYFPSLLQFCLPIFLSCLLFTLFPFLTTTNYTQNKTEPTVHWFRCQHFEWQLHVEHFEPPADSSFSFKKVLIFLLSPLGKFILTK